MAIARELVAAGASVAMFDRDQETLVRAVDEVISDSRNNAVMGVAVDVQDVETVRGAIADVRERLGDVSVLVNNAGVTRDAYLRKMTYEQFDEVVDVHLRGAFMLIKACLEIDDRRR